MKKTKLACGQNQPCPAEALMGAWGEGLWRVHAQVDDPEPGGDAFSAIRVADTLRGRSSIDDDVYTLRKSSGGSVLRGVELLPESYTDLWPWMPAHLQPGHIARGGVAEAFLRSRAGLH